MPESDLPTGAVAVKVAAPVPPRPSWDEWLVGIAEAAKVRADCARRQVGAVIMDQYKNVVSVGYNGYPSGRPGCKSEGGCPRGLMTYDQVPKDSAYVGVAAPCDAIHAEENALLRLVRSVGAEYTLGVSDRPCPNCQRLIAGTPGLVRVVWRNTETGGLGVWLPSSEAPRITVG